MQGKTFELVQFCISSYQEHFTWALEMKSCAFRFHFFSRMSSHLFDVDGITFFKRTLKLFFSSILDRVVSSLTWSGRESSVMETSS